MSPMQIGFSLVFLIIIAQTAIISFVAGTSMEKLYNLFYSNRAISSLLGMSVILSVIVTLAGWAEFITELFQGNLWIFGLIILVPYTIAQIMLISMDDSDKRYNNVIFSSIWALSCGIAVAYLITLNVILS